MAGLALAPTSFAALAASARALAGLAHKDSPAFAFLAAFGGYCALHASGLLRLRPAYVFAHESSHALAAWLSGEKVHRFVVRADRGHVDLSRVTAFIALAPYWLPFYALLVALLFRVWTACDAPPIPRVAFLAAMGAALAFHACHTLESLHSGQSDLDHAGWLLSLAAIVLLNAAFTLGLSKCLFPRQVRLAAQVRGIGRDTARFWRWTWRELAELRA